MENDAELKKYIKASYELKREMREVFDECYPPINPWEGLTVVCIVAGVATGFSYLIKLLFW